MDLPIIFSDLTIIMVCTHNLCYVHFFCFHFEACAPYLMFCYKIHFFLLCNFCNSLYIFTFQLLGLHCLCYSIVFGAQKTAQLFILCQITTPLCAAQWYLSRAHILLKNIGEMRLHEFHTWLVLETFVDTAKINFISLF